MSDTQAFRKAVPVRERSGRTLDQRLFLRVPRLATAAAFLIGRLPPSSRLRQGAMWRGVRLSVEAFNRRDFDAALLGHDTDCEFQLPREPVEAGLVEPYARGPSGYRRVASLFAHVGDLYLEQVEVIDLGDRLVLLADMSVRWQRADIPLSRMWANVITLERGRVIREQYFWDHAEALEAVGLREEARAAARG
jgi:ketosteroid isomerase-like protein